MSIENPTLAHFRHFSSLLTNENRVSSYLRAYKALHLSRIIYKSALFMQNKPNFHNDKMNVSSVKIKSYEQLTMNNEPIKQTQSNPTCSELVEPISNVTLLKWVITSSFDVAIRQLYKYNSVVMAKYPIFLELAGRRVVLIGGGTVAVRKAQTLLVAGARLVVVAERIGDMLTALCADTNAELIKSRYSKDYLGGAVLAIAATNNRQLNKQIYKDCQQLEILCNVVDEPELCDFFVPAVVKRGNLQIAIGTEGHCPAYTGHIRKKLERTFTDKHGDFLAELERLRKRIITDVPDPADRKALLGQLADDKSFEHFNENGPAAWRERAEKIIEEHTSQAKT